MSSAPRSAPSSLNCTPTTLLEALAETVTAEPETVDMPAFVRDLKKQPGRGICLMGGGELARSLFEAELVDEVGLNIHPILLGGGIPMFPAPGPRVSLKLLSSRVLSGGCVLANFRVQHRRARKGAKSAPGADRAELAGAVT